MQQLLDTGQMRAADQHTLQRAQITEEVLIDRAAEAFVLAFCTTYPDRSRQIGIYCGPGNNGADGLMIAWFLQQKGYTHLQVYLCCFQATPRPAFTAKLALVRDARLPVRILLKGTDATEEAESLTIEALFGSGLNKPLQGDWAKLITRINQSRTTVVAVDIPAGMPAEGKIMPDWPVIQADLVICFQRPKINFFFPESARAVARFQVVDIGLDENFIQSQKGPFQLISTAAIQKISKSRKNFSHKGTYGHALLIAGQAETMGAALLAAAGCLYAGAGLTTAAIPFSGLTALNTALPEVMYTDTLTLKVTGDLQKYTTIGAGPGLGDNPETAQIVQLLLQSGKPLILDADALNVLSGDQQSLQDLPAGTVITPHKKEFDRLFGQHETWWERIETAREWTRRTQNVLVLKNQYTFIINPAGEVLINSTGNPAMAQGGMGDVLTGILTALRAQGYDPAAAAVLACYIHGKCGDELAENQTTIRASVLASRIPEIWKRL